MIKFKMAKTLHDTDQKWKNLLGYNFFGPRRPHGMKTDEGSIFVKDNKRGFLGFLSSEFDIVDRHITLEIRP